MLGQVCHPRRYHDVRAWCRQVATAHEVLILEVADYELRRELIRIGAQPSIDHLDELERELRCVPVQAARVWAPARSTERGAGGIRLTSVLLAVQALAE